MVELNDQENLTEVLKAMGDATRRALLTQLCQQGVCRVTDLANFYDISLNAISKHIKVLEKAGLITRTTQGRTHWIQANLKQVAIVENWLKDLKSIWAMRLDRLDDIMQNGENEND